MKLNINWDAMGITTSVACAIHCAILPLLFSSFPLFGINILHNIYFEVLMIALAAGIGFYTFYHSFKKHHHSYRPAILFGIGLFFLIAKQISHQWEWILLIPAVIFIITAHYLNFKMCRWHDHAHSDDCDH